jgi:hypothetical protein
MSYSLPTQRTTSDAKTNGIGSQKENWTILTNKEVYAIAKK